MNKRLLLPIAFAGIASLVGFQNSSVYKIEQLNRSKSHVANTGGPAAGKTGAPGEVSCTQCHSGTAQSGSGVNTLVVTENLTPVTSYTPGTVYNVAISMASASAKNGFQVVALDGTNAQAGTVTLLAASTTQTVNGSAGKKYVTQTAAGTASTAWAFQWTAPATNVGTVTFYLATNETNNLNNSSGDVIRLSQHAYGSVAGIAEEAFDMDLTIGYAASNNVLSLDYAALTAGETFVNLVDLSGKSVFNESIGSTEIGDNSKAVKLPSELKSGMYIVHLNVNNNFTSKKIYIQ